MNPLRPINRFVSSLLRKGIRAARRLPIIGPALVQASFDAVRQTWGERSWLFQSLQDSWQEMDSLTRKELQRIHEALIENSCVVQKIRRLYLQFSVGSSGLICTPNASRWRGPTNSDQEKTLVEDWNHSRGEAWERWFRAPEINSSITGAQLTRVWSGMLFDKGEIFVNFTYEDARNGRGSLVSRTPKLQTIDAHRCQSPEGMSDYQGNPIIDGVEISPTGKVIAYWFKKTNFSNAVPGNSVAVDSFDRITVLDPKTGRCQLVHKFKSHRPGQLRGLPEGVSVYNLVRDNMDLHKLEMQAAKLASDIATVETNASGELDSLANRRARVGISTQATGGVPTTKEIWADYKVSIGSKNVALKSGDKLEQFMVSRPTVATQAYWDLHYTLICIGYNVPKILVMPYSLQGTVTRADLDICSYGFGREHFELIKELLEEIYAWQSDWAVKYDPTMDGDVPEDYLAVNIRPPRPPNVDIGYTAKALETELALGVKTIPEVFAEKQQDFRPKTREIAEYLKYVKDVATEFGVEAGQITSLLAASAAADPQATPNPTEKPDGVTDQSIEA